ncbi:hypothetical protein DFH11DRAFT_1723925 [Phellopilus nigrolimitatus]|nr:hypothetical protein DFH11DRAFT_1723925 [Phellopilus nigrolimitatus]
MPEHIYARLRRREWDAQMNREERLARQPPVYNAVPLNGQVLKGVFNGLAKAHPPRCVAIHERIKDPQALPTPAPTGQNPGTNLPSSAVSPPGPSSCLNQTSHTNARASEFGTYMVGKKTFSVFMPKKPPPPAPFAQPVRLFTKGRFLRRVITLPENPSVTVLPQTVLSRAPGEDTYGAQKGRHHPFVYMGAAQDPTLGCMLQISDDVEGPSGFPHGIIKLGFHEKNL